jgi:GntR family transcriptional regulator
MKIVILNSSSSPIYEQIAEQIKAQIIDESLEAGSPLPSIRNLAKDLHISVITTKRAYDELESEGFIDTVGGKGTFVADQNRELLREARMRIVEEHLTNAITEAKKIGLDRRGIKSMIDLLYPEEEA